MNAPKMPEIRQAIAQARALDGQEDTQDFAVEAPRLLARLVQILDLYVGHEPTLAEEAEHVRAEHRAEALEEKAEEVFEDTRQKYSRVIAIHGVDKAALWFTGREDAAKLIANPAGSTQSAPDFFQPGHGYTRRDGTTFQCVAVTTHPSNGERLALGWHTDADDWTFLDHRNLGQWLHEYDGVAAPTGNDREDAAPDYKAAVGRALELLETAPEAFHPAPSQNIAAAAHVLRQTHEAGGGQ